MRYILYSGAGNTFAIVEQPISSREATLLCEACQADGVIFPQNVFQMRIFNRDGSEAEMCGNGLRCFVKFLIERNILREHYTIDTLAGPHKAWADEDQICVQFPPAHVVQWNVQIGSFTVHYLNTGVPHAVLFVESIDEVDVRGIGATIRYHGSFPEGVNVDFVDPVSLRVRTYERGVERETLACGTGVVASALVVSKLFHLPSPLSMQVQSGDYLNVSFTPDWENLILKGPARRIGEGSFCLKDKSLILSHYE